MFLFIFLIVCVLFEWKRICAGFLYRLFISVLLLEFQLSRWEGWDLMNRFNPTIYVCLSQASIWISNVTSVQCVQLRWEVIVRFVDICEIDDHFLWCLCYSIFTFMCNVLLIILGPFVHFILSTVFFLSFFDLQILITALVSSNSS